MEGNITTTYLQRQHTAARQEASRDRDFAVIGECLNRRAVDQDLNGLEIACNVLRFCPAGDGLMREEHRDATDMEREGRAFRDADMHLDVKEVARLF